ncbi:YxeA family protein [Bacillus sp. (in: firmicutes)]|uniref:YxeA family protein n=1 Tax=Bacillus sp. TaxID=1409 RepID=UPI0023F3E5C0|nr:YxeA family protein [Bacillus sp. (in: firmicutes)]
MKKIFSMIVGAGVIAAICGILFIHNDITDRISPLVPRQDLYVQINRDGQHLKPGGTEYTLDGYNKSGEKSEVTFLASGDLRKNAYLKVYTKGKYVETWEEVQYKDLPKNVQSQLKQ